MFVRRVVVAVAAAVVAIGVPVAAGAMEPEVPQVSASTVVVDGPSAEPSVEPSADPSSTQSAEPSAEPSDTPSEPVPSQQEPGSAEPSPAASSPAPCASELCTTTPVVGGPCINIGKVVVIVGQRCRCQLPAVQPAATASAEPAATWEPVAQESLPVTGTPMRAMTAAGGLLLVGGVGLAVYAARRRRVRFES